MTGDFVLMNDYVFLSRRDLLCVHLSPCVMNSIEDFLSLNIKTSVLQLLECGLQFLFSIISSVHSLSCIHGYHCSTESQGLQKRIDIRSKFWVRISKSGNLGLDADSVHTIYTGVVLVVDMTMQGATRHIARYRHTWNLLSIFCN